MTGDETFYIVTGASKGLGREMVKQLAVDPMNRILAVSRDEYHLKELANSSQNENVEFIAADLTLSNDRSNLSDWLKENWPKVDVLINNAGFLINKPFADMDEDDFDKTIAVNYKVPYFLTQKLLPFLSVSKEAEVLNIGSMGGIPAVSKFPGLSVYSSSKGALSILTECLAEELLEYKVSVNCICLGSVQTEMLNEAFPGYEAQSTPVQMAKAILGIYKSGRGVMNGKVIPLAGTGV